ncbi:MAG: two-component system, OmpR family, sensor kinase [bacterium P3]|nr:MAG: two-component system, OmpR family, sensor kinase [bacterium P3]KWW38926.1 MAG: two-component system, OmpR family, sensor kinase [bacterium F083]
MAVVVGVFALAASLYQMHSERNYKKLILKTRLEGYADRIAMFGPQVSFNEEVRVTLLSREGTVLYDSEDPGLSSDHSGRPEFLQCREDCSGWAIRHSETEGRDYCYLTKMAGDRIIRVAIPYEVDLKHFLRSDTVYTIVGLLLLLLFLGLIGHSMLRGYKSLEDALHDVENERRNNQRIKRDMTHNIAHELRTPVSSLRGYLEALTDCEDLDEERRKLFTQRAYLQTLRLSDLLRDIGLVTKIEESPDMIQVEELCLKEIVDSVLDEFAEKIASRNMNAENAIPEQLLMTGSPSLMYAVFRNLVENSYKYAGDGTQIYINASPGRCSYYDTGAGVPPEMLGTIFERFFRIPGKTGSDWNEDTGSGLGLSVVRNAVSFHGGEIKASLREGGGLAFEMSLKLYYRQ